MVSVAESAIAGKLLEAAVRLFANKGYPATSTREIVEAAGVTKPMLYYYFQSKEGLLAAAIGHFLDQFHERMRQVASQSLEPSQQLREMVWAQLDFCQQHKPLARLFYALYFGPDDQKNLVDLNQYTSVGHELLMHVVRRATASGLTRESCDEDFGMALHGMINIWIIAALNDEVILTHELAERIVTDLLRGFRRS
ncbi:MAG TPA: TetR/AcrR family transcriptional regulator [Pirellulales bacterium]|jgi:AcrR family transcriptional regulator|nr:TetR/AcrR family transcriptional regulator [Pirellulales bacterium]